MDDGDRALEKRGTPDIVVVHCTTTLRRRGLMFVTTTERRCTEINAWGQGTRGLRAVNVRHSLRGATLS